MRYYVEMQKWPHSKMSELYDQEENRFILVVIEIIFEASR